MSVIKDKMELAKAEAYIDGDGKITADHYFDILEEEGIILDKEKDVVDNGDGTYEVTTEPGYVFEVEITEDGDMEIDYVGKGENIGPRIREIKITGTTTNSVTIEVDARNAEDADYTYSYKKVGEEEWKEVETSKSNTCTIENLEAQASYTIKVKVETKNGVAEKEISTTIGELPEGTITFGEVEWVGDGTASVAINTSETSYQLQYQKNGIEGQWTTIGSGEKITGLVHNDTVYGRLFDGINGTKDEASVSIQDEVDPVVTVSPGTKTTNSIAVNVAVVDRESGMKDNPTYNYYIKKTSEDDSSYVLKGNTLTETSYTFTGLTQETSYDVKVEVTGDKAGRTGTGTLPNQTTTKVGGAEGDLTTGNIVASSPTWNSGEASITLTTDTGMQIQYQVNGTNEGSWTTVSTGAQVTGLHHNDTVYARLYDGVNTGNYGSISIRDEVDPVVTVSPGTKTTNSITVSAVAVDNESGMADNLTYTYYIKKSTETDSSYVAKASDITQNSYTFTGLTQETSYDVKVEVTGDKAGRTGTGTLPNQTTTKVGGAEGDLTTGNIVASSPTWSNGEASITLTTNTGMQIQYQVNGINEGQWTTAITGATVSGLHHNDTVFARLTDGYNVGTEASVTIKDEIAPIISNVSTSNLTYDSVTVTVTANDEQSGLATSGTYEFYINNEKKATETNNSYTFKKLTAGTEYNIKVVVKDKANNEQSKEIKIATLDAFYVEAPNVVEGMTPVKYVSGTGWVKTTTSDPEWYNYSTNNLYGGADAKSWANVVLADSTFNGNILNENNPYSMLVWIPRFAYKIESYYHATGNSTTAGKIDIVFIDKNNKDANGKTYQATYPSYTEGTTGKMNDYVVHPAFDYGGNQISGFWVGKFEASNTDCNSTASSGEYNGTDKTLQIKAGVTSWRNISISNMYEVCVNMNESSNNVYGLNTQDFIIDPHLMKNSEWGAVAYLSKSIYGKETEEVWGNPSSNYITGQAGTKATSENLTTTNNYTTENGQKASTNGNVTGIYDMSGGAWESVAAYIDNAYSSSSIKTAVSSGKIEHADVYKKGDSDNQTDNYYATKPTEGQGVPTNTSGHYGDAIYETSGKPISNTGGWYADYADIPNLGSSYFIRGGYDQYGKGPGMFSFFYNLNKSAGADYGFRVVLTPNASLPEASGGLASGNIVASSPTWSSGTASITLTTSTGMQIQYQVNGINEGNWTTVSTGATVSGLHHNDTVYARLFDGTNVGDYGSVSIIDNTPPTVSISTSNLTHNSVTLKVTASDNESGLATSGTYKYYLGSTLKTTSTSSSYNYTGLTASTSYTLKVVVTDKAGKTTEKSTIITTAKAEIADIIGGSDFAKTTEVEDDAGNKIWIPGGFNVAEDSATNEDEGIVIEDSKGNEFIWVPVKDYTTMYTEGTVTLNGVASQTTVYSKLRATNGSNIAENPGTTTGKREPDVLSSYDPDPTYYSILGYNSFKQMADEMVAEYKATYESIKKYKGFYIGRYELTGTITSPTVQKGKTVITGQNWYNLKEACTNIVSTSYAQSTMIYGNQWDEVMAWLKETEFASDTSKVDNDSSSWGNYSGTKRASGYNEAWQANNIYDLAGNCFEWTQEANKKQYRVFRGRKLHCKWIWRTSFGT